MKIEEHRTWNKELLKAGRAGGTGGLSVVYNDEVAGRQFSATHTIAGPKVP